MKKKHLQKMVFSLCAMGVLFTSCEKEEVDETLNADSPASVANKDQSFTLLPAESELIRIEPIQDDSFKTTEAPGIDRGRFNITLKYLVPVTERQREVFDAAAARWEKIIIKDLSSIPQARVVDGVILGGLPSAFTGFPVLNLDGAIDDLVIEVALIPIDGPGNILGSAGPRFVRTSNRLPISGVMQFDVDDLDFLDEVDLFEEVIVHEMGHVLGVGTLWNSGDKSLRQGPTTNPYFTGKMANVFWNAEGGKFKLPIENEGGRGTAGSHWRESLLNNELMTGYLNLGENPLSRITAGSMKDLGYGAASVGEQYDLPKGTPGVKNSELDGMKINSSEGINISEREILLQPIGEVVDK